MNTDRQSTRKITYILVSVLTIIGITLAIPGIIGEAENDLVDKKKSETTEATKIEVMEPEETEPVETESFTGWESDLIDKKIMKSEMEWDSEPEEQEKEEQDENEDGETSDQTEEELTDLNQEPPWTNSEENEQPSQGESQYQEQPGNQEDENNSPTEPEDGHIHTYGEWETITNPTCTESGEQTRICSCGDRETMTIPPIGHSWSEDLEIVTEHYCDGCGHYFGPNSSEEERNIHQMFDENGNERDAEGQELHTPVSNVTKYHVCVICGMREEVQ